MALPLLGFLVSAAVIFFAGRSLARRADAIAEATGLGRLWIGSVLLAGATSLPEVVTGISAVRLEAPDLAAGDLFGACMANMLALALIGLLPPRHRVFQQVAFDHALSAALAIMLLAMAIVFVLVPTPLSFLGIGLESSLLLTVYLLGTRVTYRQTLFQLRANRPPSAGEAAAQRPVLGRSWVGFALAAAAIFVAAPVFAASAERIAEITGLGTTFVGTVMVALCTTLPELVTSLSAARMGAFDLAVGNLFGSNAFNIAIFFAIDLAHPAGSIFAVLSPQHAISGLFAIILMGEGLAAIMYRAERRFAMLEPGSAVMLLTYLLGLWLLYSQVSPA